MEIQQARRQPLTTAVEPTPVTMTVTTTASPEAAMTDDVFVDAHWTTELSEIQVQEIDGTWRDVTVFRNKQDKQHVCLWFGGTEYEGTDPDHPYYYCPRSESLEDDEGFEINWRIKGLENDREEDEDEDEDHDETD